MPPNPLVLTGLTSDMLLAPEGVTINMIGCETKAEFEGVFLGIDPGQVHMGVACIFTGRAYLYEITLEAAEQSVEAMMRVTSCMQLILAGLPRSIGGCVVEGAAHMASWGQVPLETARTSAAIAAMSHGIWPVEVVPPKKIRQQVFGNGLVRQQMMWPEYPENAVSALGCALYAKEVFSRK